MTSPKGSRFHPTSPWPARDDELRALAAEGISYRAAALRMGMTSNQVIGRAHRLKLPARPSPIKAASPDATQPQKPAKAPPSPFGRMSYIAPRREALAAVLLRPGVRYTTCQHIAGHVVRGVPTVMCDAPTSPRSPYCPAHHAACRAQPAPEDMAAA